MQKLKSILSFLLAGVLLASTIGFSVSRHYCMGMLKHETFFSVADDCDHENEKDSSSKQLKKGCCEDELILINGLEVVSPSIKSTLNEVGFHWSATATIAENEIQTPYASDDILRPTSKAPPEKGCSLFIEYERFLI